MKNRPSSAFARNEGIVISGHGSIKSENITVGRSAKSYMLVSPALTKAFEETLEKEHILAKLRELEKAINDHAAATDRPQEMSEATRVVAQQLANEKPEKWTLFGALGSLAEGFKAATAVTAAVDGLKSAISTLF